MCQPGNDLLAINLLLLGVLTLGRSAFAGAKAADVHPHADVSPPSEIGMLRIVAGRRAIIFPIRQVFQQGREFLFRPGSVRSVERSGKSDAVFHWNPGLLHTNFVKRRGGWVTRECTTK